jgi:hypothetical protein
MSYKGERALPLQLTAASALVRNRLVTITSGVPAYPGYGETALGITRNDSDVNDYVTPVMPLSNLDSSVFIDIVGTVTAHALLFPTGILGKAKASDYTFKSRSVGVATSTNGHRYIVPTEPTNLAAWTAALGTLTTGDHAYRVGGAWTEVANVAGDIGYVEDEGCYIAWTGTAWVTVEAVGRASSGGVTGDTIPMYNDGSLKTPVTWEDLEDAIRSVTKVVAAGTATVVSGQTAIGVLDDRINVGDYCQTSIVTKGTNAAYIVGTSLTADAVTITVNTDPGSGGCVIYYEIKRLIS